MNSRTAKREEGTGHRESCTREDTAVLVVMSSPRRCEPLVSELENNGFKVRTARSFHEARQCLEAGPNINVVITDISLPDANWCDVLRFLVNSGIRTSVVVTASAADASLRSEAIRRGAYDLLIQPFQAVRSQADHRGGLHWRRSGPWVFRRKLPSPSAAAVSSAADPSDSTCDPCDSTRAEAADEEDPDPAFILEDRETH